MFWYELMLLIALWAQHWYGSMTQPVGHWGSCFQAQHPFREFCLLWIGMFSPNDLSFLCPQKSFGKSIENDVSLEKGMFPSKQEVWYGKSLPASSYISFFTIIIIIIIYNPPTKKIPSRTLGKTPFSGQNCFFTVLLFLSSIAALFTGNTKPL